MAYPLKIFNQRSFTHDYHGPVCICDIDKTYLATAFSSAKGLLRIPVEFAIDKRALPGMPTVLRGIRRGTGPGIACTPLYFVTSSPPQLRRVIERKMLMDGVEYDGFIFKDWLGTLSQLRPRRLREHIGFKLCALLEGRSERPLSQEYLIGDDVDTDAQAFSLYSRILQGELDAGQTDALMNRYGVCRTDRRSIRCLRDRLGKKVGRVGRIYIKLERGTSPNAFEQYGSIIAPVRGAYQLALALYHDQLIDRLTVQQTLSELQPEDKQQQTHDALTRGLISASGLKSLATHQ